MHWPVQFSHGSNSGGQSIDSAAGGASTPLSVEAHIGLLTYNVLALTSRDYIVQEVISGGHQV